MLAHIPEGSKVIAVTVKYLINIVSLMRRGLQPFESIPGCFFAPPGTLITEAKEIGYDGVMGLPVRGLLGVEPGVLHFEKAWNAVGSFWQALRHKLGTAGLPSQIHDWVLFPSPRQCRIVAAEWEVRVVPQVVHEFDGNPRHLVEVHPELEMNLDKIVFASQVQGQRLVLDTLHLLRPHRDHQTHPPYPLLQTSVDGSGRLTFSPHASGRFISTRLTLRGSW